MVAARRRWAATGVAVVVAGLGALALACARRTSPDEAVAPAGGGTRLVVLLAERHGDPRPLARAHGLRLVRSLSAFGAAVLEDAPGAAPGEALTRLRADDRVRTAEADLTLRVAAGCCEAELDPGDEAAALAAARAWSEAWGGAIRRRTAGDASQVVAILDTGCDQRHADLAGALVTGLSVIAGAPWFEDPNGHGTAMASLVAGVAPGVSVLPVRVADASGACSLADVATGIVAAVDRGARVILISLGARRPATLLGEAIRWAEARGALVVAAAGNASADVDLHPAADEAVLSVGCVEDDDRLAFGTALAPTTDLLAPGVGASIALPGQRHGVATGTSVAAARVAGLAALLRTLAPELPPSLLRRLLARGTRPLEALRASTDSARQLRAGVLDTDRLVALLDGAGPTLRIADARALPERVRADEPVVGLVRVENHGLVPSAPTDVVVRTSSGALRVPVPELAPLEEVVIRADLRAPGPGRLGFALGAQRLNVELGAAPPAGLRDLALLAARAVPGVDGDLELVAVVEGRGSVPQEGAVGAWVCGEPMGVEPVPRLAPGETAEVRFLVPAARLAPQADYLPVHLSLGGDDEPRNDAVVLTALAPAAQGPGGAPLAASTQYQQDDQLNLIADAPHRLEPGRPYVPVMVFMPEKGDVNPSTWVELEQVTITSRPTPTRQPGVPDLLVYDDHLGGATTAPAGLVIADDDGQPALRNGAPDPRLFQHGRLSEPGRCNVLRLPRDAFGLSTPQTAPEDRYLEVTFRWKHNRRVLFSTTTRTGTRRWVLKVTFASDPRPRLSGTDAYFDAHCHTIAEWYQDDRFDPLAPKRNFCGPLPMLMEVAHAVGLTDAVDAVRGRLITTDHNATMNPGDTLRERPQVGLSSPASSHGLSEWDRYRELFGDTAAEEITLESWGSTSVGSVTVPTPGESHLLSYRGEHALGPWHGNSALAQLIQGQTFPRVRIQDVLALLATTNRPENRDAAVFPAHPFGGDWTADDFRTAFEQDAARRTDGSVHQEQTGFVAKGLQFWNSDGKRHKLDPSRIDWDDLNPWADPDWQRGRADWDSNLQDGLGRWHAEFLAPCLEYELKARPGVRFPRKVFALAGNDAHGDFNFQTSRKATLVRQQSSFEVSGRSFGRCVTYALADLQPAGTPAADRAFEAFLDGNALLSDGPLLVFSLDSEDRFDGARLMWHDARRAHEDADGRIGGGGDFDGRGTALVRRGSPDLRYRYRWLSTSEYGGDVERIEVYRTSVGDPNPMGQKPGNHPLLLPRGGLAPGRGGQDQEEALDPAEEGAITTPSVLALGGFTDPDPARMGPDERRCYTNPVWCVPFDADVAVVQSEVDASGAGRIPPGGLRVRLDFDMSLLPLPYAVEVKGLDGSGDSTDSGVGALSALVPASGTGWSSRGALQDAHLELTNQDPIPLDGPRWPAGSGQVTYVVYFRDPLIDPFGNGLHRIAFTFSTDGVGGPSAAWPAPPPPGSGSGTTAPGATPAPPPAAPAGRGGSGGCALEAPARERAPGAPLALVLLLAMLRRGRREACARAR